MSNSTGVLSALLGMSHDHLEMTIEGRIYEILNPFRKGTLVLHAEDMEGRAKEVGANCGEDDGEHILKHHDQIPEEMQGFDFVLPDWPNSFYTGWGYCHGFSTLSRSDDCWKRGCVQKRHGVYPLSTRVLRRIR